MLRDATKALGRLGGEIIEVRTCLHALVMALTNQEAIDSVNRPGFAGGSIP